MITGSFLATKGILFTRVEILFVLVDILLTSISSTLIRILSSTNRISIVVIVIPTLKSSESLIEILKVEVKLMSVHVCV